MNFYDEVYKFCRQIPKGRVSTYKELAKAMNTKAYRAVGQALRNNPYAPKVPCHRVVNSKGFLHGFNGKMEGNNLKDKERLLLKEGVKVKNNKVIDFDKKLFKF